MLLVSILKFSVVFKEVEINSDGIQKYHYLKESFSSLSIHPSMKYCTNIVT